MQVFDAFQKFGGDGFGVFGWAIFRGVSGLAVGYVRGVLTPRVVSAELGMAGGDRVQAAASSFAVVLTANIIGGHE